MCLKLTLTFLGILSVILKDIFSFMQLFKYNLVVTDAAYKSHFALEYFISCFLIPKYFSSIIYVNIYARMKIKLLEGEFQLLKTIFSGIT